MLLTRIKIFKNINGEWIDQCTGAISHIKKDVVVVEDDASSSQIRLSVHGKSYYKSEEVIVIIYDDNEEHAICFETEDIRDSFFEYLELKDIAVLSSLDIEDMDGNCEVEVNSLDPTIRNNHFFSLAKISKYAEDVVFEEMLGSKDGVVSLLNMGNFHLFKRLLENSKKIFALFGIPFGERIMPQMFYVELITKEVDEELLRLYEKFLIVLNKQELAKKEAKISGMSDNEMKDFLKKCYNGCYKIGDVEVYLNRIYTENRHFPEMFYYLCQLFKAKIASTLDFRFVLNGIRNLLNSESNREEALYVFEGLYTLLGICEGETLDVFYAELEGFFDDVEYHPDMQRFLLYLFSNHTFRIREFLLNTGLLMRILKISPRDAKTEMFMAKIFYQIVSCGCKYMHLYCIKNDLLKNTIGIYKNRNNDAVYSIFLQALSKINGELEKYVKELL